jgi:hypothetical protein
MNQEGMFKPALIGGVLLGILSALPFVNLLNCFCCAWVIGGGVLASYLYVRDAPPVVTLGQGLILGLLTGVIGAIISVIFSIPLRFMLAGVGADVMQQVIDRIPNLPPETKGAMRSAFASNSLGIASFVIGAFFTLVIYAVVAMLGGAIGVALFEKRKPQAPGEVYQSPAVPPPSPPAVPPPPTQ